MQARSDMPTMINIRSVSSNLKSVVKLLITKFKKHTGVFFVCVMVIVISIIEAYQ